MPNTQFEVADTATILSMVEVGIGISFLPKLTLPSNPSNIVVIDLTPPVYRPIYLAAHSSSSASPAVRAFIAEAQSWVKEHR